MDLKLRRLDSEIAKRFFNYTICEDDTHSEYDGWCRTCQKFKAEHYSTNIQIAWKIVEELAKQGITTQIEYKGSDREYQFTTEVTMFKNIFVVGHSVGNIADAIVNAALSIEQ